MVIDKDVFEKITALAAAVARYQMAIEAIKVCDYGVDREKIAREALK